MHLQRCVVFFSLGFTCYLLQDWSSEVGFLGGEGKIFVSGETFEVKI